MGWWCVELGVGGAELDVESVMSYTWPASVMVAVDLRGAVSHPLTQPSLRPPDV